MDKAIAVGWLETSISEREPRVSLLFGLRTDLSWPVTDLSQLKIQFQTHQTFLWSFCVRWHPKTYIEKSFRPETLFHISLVFHLKCRRGMHFASYDYFGQLRAFIRSFIPSFNALHCCSLNSISVTHQNQRIQHRCMVMHLPLTRGICPAPQTFLRCGLLATDTTQLSDNLCPFRIHWFVVCHWFLTMP